MKLINIGFGNMVSANRLIAIVSPESAPIKRIVQEARDKGVLIDATYGRRTRAYHRFRPCGAQRRAAGNRGQPPERHRRGRGGAGG